MNTSLNWPLIRLLIVKDWQLFEKQLAAYVLGGVVALGLLGLLKPWSFYIGSLLLLVLMVAVACFSISNSLINERKERTLAFVMSLPVSPREFLLAKLLGNLATFTVPYTVLTLGAVAMILFTPLPDGLFVYWLLVAGHILFAYSLSLAVALSLESEGWNTFVMITSQVLINPFIMGLGQIPAIADTVRGNAIVWSVPAVAILLAQVLGSVALLAFAGWRQARKPAFY